MNAILTLSAVLAFGITLTPRTSSANSFPDEILQADTELGQKMRQMVRMEGNGSHLGILDARGLRFWELQGDRAIPVDPPMVFSHAYDLHAGAGHHCVADERGLWCWNWDDRRPVLYRGFEHAKSLSISKNVICGFLFSGRWACMATHDSSYAGSLSIPESWAHSSWAHLDDENRLMAMNEGICREHDSDVYCLQLSETPGIRPSIIKRIDTYSIDRLNTDGDTICATGYYPTHYNLECAGIGATNGGSESKQRTMIEPPETII